MCASAKMQALFQHGISVYTDIFKTKQHGMLFITDIIDSIGLPPNTKYIDTHIHANDKNVIESNADFVVLHVQDIPDLLHKNSALVLTYAKHTVAVYCDSRNKFYIFDSLPAFVLSVERHMLVSHLFGHEASLADLEAFGVFIDKK